MGALSQDLSDLGNDRNDAAVAGLPTHCWPEKVGRL
jgi:hypothetical protein